MGAITTAKKIYDQRAVDAFSSAGWRTFSINKPGRYADVIGVKEDTLAIVEVKSPNEISAVRGYDDSANLSFELDRIIGGCLKTARNKVFDLFRRGETLMKLYAVSVACQLYRYVYEFKEKSPEYERAIHSAGYLTQTRFTKIPYLVVPIEHFREAQQAMAMLRENRYISNYRGWNSGSLWIVELTLR